MTAITGVGAYAPRFRISADAFEKAWGHFDADGVETKAVPAADEDALTMAYEAATRGIEAAGTDPGAVGWIGFASSRPPLAEEDLTARLGAMLGVSESATRHVFTGSTRAGTRALRAGGDALEAGREIGLVVAADAPAGATDGSIDHAAGAGAAAFVLEGEGPAEIRDHAEYAAPYPGTRFRVTGEDETRGLGVTQYDRRAFTESIAGAVDGLDADPDAEAAAIQAPDGKLPYRAADAAGVGTGDIRAAATVHALGDLGAASVPVSLAAALEAGHRRVLAVSQGGGAVADAFVVKASGETPARTALDGDGSLSYAEYLRQRGVVTNGPPSGGGAYVSVPSWRRSVPQRYNLEAGRCPACGAFSFPPEGACTGCGALCEYERVRLPGTGTIEAVTTVSQGGAPPEFAEQQARAGEYATAIVALDAGVDDASVSVAAMGTDAAPEAFGIGDRVETTIRRIYTQEGVTRYGFKIRPAGARD
ncbi:zinc ribbon domain-containing protein [Natronomonas sp.]|uniref:zinc ribbon domain-containing protein n=1 Tax=Natronomonas sp. TaxID=2184060 RepID=UPI00263373F8|nr:zinc ribbon domain-containing protein [Natronomonas sp.]